MAHRHDVEFIEVVFEAIALPIPGHGALQGSHGVAGVGPIAGLHVDAQGHLAAAGGGEAVGHLLQLAGHQGKQVGGLGEGVVPAGEMAGRSADGIGRQLACCDAVAVGEQHRATGPIRLDPHPEAAE